MAEQRRPAFACSRYTPRAHLAGAARPPHPLPPLSRPPCAQVKPDLTRTQRTNLETCITVHMHQKEATEDLIRKKVRDPSDFEWLKQVGGPWGRGAGRRAALGWLSPSLASCPYLR